MTSRAVTPARVVARRECVLHALMAAHVRDGNEAAAMACRRRLEGWRRLRSMLARDEPRGAWLN